LIYAWKLYEAGFLPSFLFIFFVADDIATRCTNNPAYCRAGSFVPAMVCVGIAVAVDPMVEGREMFNGSAMASQGQGEVTNQGSETRARKKSQ